MRKILPTLNVIQRVSARFSGGRCGGPLPWGVVGLSRRVAGDAPGRDLRRGQRGPRRRPLPRRDVHFALENDGWNCTFECEVHVSASAAPGKAGAAIRLK